MPKGISKLLGVWKKSPNHISHNTILQIQNLQTSLKDANHSHLRENVLALEESLDSKVPLRAAKLMENALDKSGNALSSLDKQTIFRGIVKRGSLGSLSSKLYVQLNNSPKLSENDKIINIKTYLFALRDQKNLGDAYKFLVGIMRQHFLSDADLEEIFDKIKENPDKESLVCLVTNGRRQPDQVLLKHVLSLLSELQGPTESAIQELVEYVLFENPHFEIDHKCSVLILDTLLAKDMASLGAKVLPKFAHLKPDVPLLELFLQCCIHFQTQAELGSKIAKELILSKDTVKETWDVLVQWKIYSCSDLSGMRECLDKMDAAGHTPDSDTFSGALQVACNYAKRSPEDVERIRNHFNHHGVICDAAGYQALVQRALDAVDLDTANELFCESIENGADWSSDREFATLNRMLVEFAQTPSQDPQKVLDLYDRLRFIRPKLEYQALRHVLRTYLDIDDISGACDFLILQYGERPSLAYSTHNELYSLFYSKIMATNDHKKAWRLYGILNTTIVLPYETYYPFQKKFCDMGRPDAAHLIFRHLRNRGKTESIKPPGREMYLMLFHEYGKWLYEEGISELEVYFRVDLNNDMDIDIMNAMLVANARTDNAAKVADLWSEVTLFPKDKGPNNLTVDIMLRAYTNVSMKLVEDLWVLFPESLRLQPSPSNLKNYIIANCYHGYYMRAVELIETCPEQFGFEVTPELLETLYNWTFNDSRRAIIERWALEKFPEQWALLENEKRLRVTQLDDEVCSIDAIEARIYAQPLVKCVYRTTDAE